MVTVPNEKITMEDKFNIIERDMLNAGQWVLLNIVFNFRLWAIVCIFLSTIIWTGYYTGDIKITDFNLLAGIAWALTIYPIMYIMFVNNHCK